MDPTRIGRYRIQRRLGRGGMGALYLAEDPDLDRLVAIKLLRDDFGDDEELRARFAREARSAARLKHPNIIIIFDVGEDDGRPFIAMEYLSGETLTQILRRTPPLPLWRRLVLIEQLSAGLAHAHAAGVIHRDIKPDNMMLDGEGALKILDFGIARLANSGMTLDGVMLGSVNYMSPEQVVGGAIDARSDVFAAGAVLYEAVSLKKAFPGGMDSGVLHRIVEGGPRPLRELVAEVDPELEAIVQRALDRDPANRYQEIASFRRDLTRVRRRLAEQEPDNVFTNPEEQTLVRTTPPPGLVTPRPDSGGRRRLDPARAAQLRREQVDQHLRAATDAFERADYHAAVQHAERAATVDPDNRDAFDLIDRARAELDRAVARKLVTEAEHLFGAGHLDDAAAVAIKAAHAVAELTDSALHRQVDDVSERIRVARERVAQIDSLLRRAQKGVGDRQYETALRAIGDLLALDPAHAAARELDRIARAELERVRAVEDARRTAYALVAAARSRALDGAYEEALATLHRIDPPSDTVREAVAEAVAAVQHESREAARRALLARIDLALRDGDIDGASEALQTISADDESPEVEQRRRLVARALDERRENERKRQRLEDGLASATALLSRGDFPRARQALLECRILDANDQRIATLDQQIAEAESAEQERRRQEARDRLAVARIDAARDLVAAGNLQAALSLLQADVSGHPSIDEERGRIAGAIAEQEQQARLHAEQLRREEEARRLAEAQAARRRAEERAAEERAAKERAAEERAAQERAAQERAAEERAAEERAAKERAARERAAEDRRIAEQQRRDAEEQARRRAEQLEIKRSEAEEARRRATEEDRRRDQEITQLIDRAGHAVSHREAIDILDSALTLAPGDPRLQTLLLERRSALTAQRSAEEPRAEPEPRVVEQPERGAAEASGLAARRREAAAPVDIVPPPLITPSAPIVIAKSRVGAIARPVRVPVAIGAAVLLIIATAVVIWVAHESHDERTQSAPVVENAAPPAPVSVAPAKPPEVAPVPPRESAGSPLPSVDTARTERINELNRRAGDLHARGDVRGAFAALREVLDLKPDDSTALKLQEILVSEAAQAMNRSKQDAVAAGAPTSAQALFRTGLDRERAAERERRAGQIDRQLTSMSDARDRFDAAAEAARLARPVPPPSRVEASPSVGRDTASPPTIQPPSAEPRPPIAVTPPPAQTLPPPRVEPPPPVDERPAIMRTLRAWESAWASLDPEAVRRVHQMSAADFTRVRDAIQQAREYQVSVQVQDVRVAPNGRQAIVTATVVRTFVPKRLARVAPSSSMSTFTLEKRGDDWIIVALQ